MGRMVLIPGLSRKKKSGGNTPGGEISCFGQPPPPPFSEWDPGESQAIGDQFKITRPGIIIALFACIAENCGRAEGSIMRLYKATGSTTGTLLGTTMPAIGELVGAEQHWVRAELPTPIEITELTTVVTAIDSNTSTINGSASQVTEIALPDIDFEGRRYAVSPGVFPSNPAAGGNYGGTDLLMSF